jgi:hypothetical protein
MKIITRFPRQNSKMTQTITARVIEEKSIFQLQQRRDQLSTTLQHFNISHRPQRKLSYLIVKHGAVFQPIIALR